MQYLKLSVYAAILVFSATAIDPSQAFGSPGDLDLLFGINGKVITSSGFSDEASAVAIQADGKVVVVGSRLVQYPTFTHGLVARYNSDGSLDTSFGLGGFVTAAGHSAHRTLFKAVKIQADGKIVVAGHFVESGGCSGPRGWIFRYNADGSLDTTFTDDGTTEILFKCFSGDHAVTYLNSLAIQPDGKIVVAGSADMTDGNLDFAILRLNPNGMFDATFNLDGLATVAMGTNDDEAFSVALHPTNGRIILAGYTINSSGTKDFSLMMLGPTGLADFGFGSLGKSTINFASKHDQANAVAFQPDGKILVGGYATYALLDLPDPRFGLARLTTGGSLDSTFGTGGKVTTNFGPLSDSASGIALQSDGKIVAVGTSINTGGTSANFALTRYNSNGVLDATFSGDGKQTTDFLGGSDYGRAVVIQADGKIVSAGSAANGSDVEIALSRYEP